ncbi:MAG: glycoside hydrolase family 2 TIM barrel-domain containing protein, partial [Bacteroidota bacterium]
MRALFTYLILLTLSGPVAAQFVRELPDVGQTERFSDPAYGGYSARRVLPARTHADGFDANLRYELEGTWGMFYREDDVRLPTDSLPDLEAEDWAYKQLQVPGTWDRQHTELFDKQMPVYLRYKFQYDPNEHPQHLPILQSEGIFREASVWLNGQLLGEFDLPYLPFAFPLWDALQAGSNTLVIRIDNRLTFDDLPVATQFHDGKHGWFPYGGLYRPIYIEHLPPIYPQKVLFETSDNTRLDLWVQLQNLTDRKQMLQVELGEVRDDETRPLDQVVISTPATPAQSDGQHDWASGQEWVKYSKRFRKTPPWDVDNPGNVQTYYLKISRPTAGGGFKSLATYTYNWAFKQFELQEGGQFRLNDYPIVLKGMNRHEDHYLLGPRYTDNLLDSDVGFMKSMEVNFCRPGHYPNDVRVLQKMEQSGILLVEEIPVYQLNKQQMADPHLIAQSKASLHRMIIRDFNRPGICMWSLGNEVHYWRKSARTFMQTLHEYARQL